MSAVWSHEKHYWIHDMEKPDINLIVHEPFSIATEAFKKGDKVKLAPADARIAVSIGRAKFATDEDKEKAYAKGELGEPGVRTRVEMTGEAVVEEVIEHKTPYVEVKSETPADEYAKARYRGENTAPVVGVKPKPVK